jgi:protein SCO1/2/putative membrane protein
MRLAIGVIVGLALVVVATVAGGVRSALGPRSPTTEEISLERLDDHGGVPDFSLTDRSGRPVTRADLLGRVWVANFIDTECTETCPVQSLQIQRLQAEFADAREPLERLRADLRALLSTP